MANAFWPGSPIKKKYAERLMAEMIRQGLLLKRQLPNRATAGVITTQGCRHVNEVFYLPGVKVTTAEVKPGTDWGSTKSGPWKPPASWRHQVRAGTFVTWAGNAFDSSLSMLFDTQIQRANPTALKRPDGILYKETDKGNIGVWVEVESARKTGPEMTKLVEALVDVQNGQAAQMFAYDQYQERIAITCRQSALVVPKDYSVEAFRRAAAKRLTGQSLKVTIARDMDDGFFSSTTETINPI